MIIGIGLDAVEIHRCAQWCTWPEKRLRRIFSEEEIRYSFSEPAKTIERLAARFALKEASFKAWSAAFGCPGPFLSWCATAALEGNKPGKLTIKNATGSVITLHHSITHTNQTAIAFVIVEK